MLASRYLTTPELKNLGFQVGEKVFIDERAIIVQPQNCVFGSHIRIDAGVIITPGRLVISDFVHVGANVHLNCNSGISIGRGSSLAQNSKLYSQSDDYTSGEIGGPWFPNENGFATGQEISLEELNIVGANSVVMPGVKLRRGSCVGANSLLKSSTETWEVWAGSPARRVSSRNDLGDGYYDKLFKEQVPNS